MTHDWLWRGLPARTGRTGAPLWRPKVSSTVGLLAILLAAGLLTGCFGNSRFKPERGMKKQAVAMEVTAYSDDKKSTNWKRNWRLQPVIASGPNKGKPKKVGITASGTRAVKGTIAADTNHYPFGTIMYVPGYGYGRVEDRGSAIKGPNRLDVFFKKKKQALDWGRRKNVTVTVWR